MLAFVDAHDLPVVQYSRAYYAVPQAKTSDKPYTLLRDTMAEHHRAAVAKVAIGTREALALLRVKDDILVLHTLYWPDEVREAPQPAADIHSRPQELTMMRSLMDRIGTDFDLTTQEDTRQRALADLVNAKLAGREPPHRETPEPTAGTGVVDLMDALRASIDATEDTALAPRKKTAAKKTPAKKPAGRRRTG